MRFILIKYFEIYVRRFAAVSFADLCELCSDNIYYYNTDFAKIQYLFHIKTNFLNNAQKGRKYGC